MSHSRVLLAGAFLSISGCTCDESIGQLRGELEPDPKMLDFGDVPVGAEKTLPLKLKNNGSFLLNVLGYEVTGPFIAPTNTGSISAYGDITVQVGFRAPALGPVEGKLIVTSDDKNAATLEVPLIGNGIEAAVVVDPLEVDFGEVLWINTTEAQHATITVSNSGTDSFDLTAIEMASDGGGAFAVDVMSAVNTYGPGATGTFDVSYLPNAMGRVEGSVRVRTTAPMGAEITVRLIGTGVGPLFELCVQDVGAAERCLSRGENLATTMGPIDINMSTSATIRVANIGNRDLTAAGSVAGPAQDFMFAPDPASQGEMTIMPGQDRRFEVTYTANDYDFDFIQVPFGSNAAENRSGNVRIEGRVTLADINIIPNAITITVEGGAFRDEVPVEIHNCGTAPLTLGNISLMQTGGPVMGVFSLTMVPMAGLVLPPENCPADPAVASFHVIFNSMTNGNYNATVSINSNDPVDPLMRVTVGATKR